MNKFKLDNLNHKKYSSPRARFKISKQMDHLNLKFAEKIIREKRMKEQNLN